MDLVKKLAMMAAVAAVVVIMNEKGALRALGGKPKPVVTEG
jgi:hypothetical protein